ncbi:SIR2 family protein [Fusobacterium perfoetens]|uniref:SIR2 family protein n=1 Tax=Fusobacterium perfoetens TaxID=852 RepID=UPI001F199DA3|nr:SIR2 family protein [Fusobacterium perfoetens]MCF2611920.1 SIR2 family protein [Fusobacterium perfoetens]
MNFFDDIKLEKKFNLITANFYKELDSCPSRVKLSDFILKSFNYSNVNNLKIDSLFEVSQTFIDQVVCTKSGLFKKIQFLYENKKFDLGYINSLIDDNRISSIVNINYDNSFCENPKAIKISPFDKTSFTVGKSKIYKPLGDLVTADTCVITKQDFRKLKVLPFYKNYFDGIRYELKLRKNIILAFDIEDSDFFEILDFIFGDYPESLNDIYMVFKNTITDNKILNFIKKYNIQILKYDSLEFLEKLETSLNIDPEILEENKKEVMEELREEVQFSLFEQPINENVVAEEKNEDEKVEEVSQNIADEKTTEEEIQEIKEDSSLENIEINNNENTIEETSNETEIETVNTFKSTEDRFAELKEKLNKIAKSIEGFKEVSEFVETVKSEDTPCEEEKNKEVTEEIENNSNDIETLEVVKNIEDPKLEEVENISNITENIEENKIEEVENIEDTSNEKIVEEIIETETSIENKDEEIVENIENTSCEETLSIEPIEEIKENISEVEDKSNKEIIEEVKEEVIETTPIEILEDKKEENICETVEEIIPKELTLEKNEFKLETALEQKYSSSGLNSFPIFASNIPEDIDLSEVEIIGSAEMKIGEHTNSSFMRILSTKDKSTSLLEIKSRELRLRFSIIYDTPGMFKVTSDYLHYEISTSTTHGRAIVVLEMLESLFGGTPMEFSFKNLSGQISLNNPTELIKIKSALNLFRLAKTAGIKIQMNKLENIQEIFYKLNLEVLLQDKNYSTWCNYETDRKDINIGDKLTFRRVFSIDKKNIEEVIVLKKPVSEKDIVDNKIIGKSKVCTVYLRKIRGEF